MFPSSNNNENPNYLHHSETLLKPPFPFPFHQNPSSSTPDDHPPFLYFPSPFLDHAGMPLSQIFAHHQQQQQQQQPLKSQQQKLHQPAHGEEPDTTPKSSSLVITPKKKRSLSSKPRKRTGKTDRHSKIKTAQGVRDRRMRLSVQIARKFFDLQDMLGFDKASKTIEWLFSNSKNAIKELSTKHNNANNNNNSSTSSIIIECGEDNSKIIDDDDDEVMKEKTRESRKEKLGFSSNPNNNNNNLEELGFSSNPSPFLDQEPNSYIDNNFIQEKSSPHEANNSTASIFECYHNLYSGISADTDSIMGDFLGNWEFDTDPRIVISPFSGNPDSNI